MKWSNASLARSRFDRCVESGVLKGEQWAQSCVLSRFDLVEVKLAVELLCESLGESGGDRRLRMLSRFERVRESKEGLEISG